jgi:hypothetical protein
MSRKKAQSGTWMTRAMIFSRAYWALSSSAKGILILFLMKRDMNKKHECLNCKELTMTYLELENLHGKKADGSPDGLSRSSITRGINDLMAKGFIEVIRQGGAYQKDKSIYGLCEDWKFWVPGKVCHMRPQGKRVGYVNKLSNLNGQNETHTLRQKCNLKSALGYQNGTHGGKSHHTKSVT